MRQQKSNHYIATRMAKYRRYLRNADYLRIISQQHLSQVTREEDSRIEMTERIVEGMIREHFSERYMIDEVLNNGKAMIDYDPSISYPTGACFWFAYNKDLTPVQAIVDIKGSQKPLKSPYWIEIKTNDADDLVEYKQFSDYKIGDVVVYKGCPFQCLQTNGYSSNNVRRPMMSYESSAWEFLPYEQWDGKNAVSIGSVIVVDGYMYELIKEGVDISLKPTQNIYWKLIPKYVDTSRYSSGNKVVYRGEPYVCVGDPNAGIVEMDTNITINDTRDQSLVKCMIQLSLYELHKNISPNNISETRTRDYMESCQWMRDCSRGKITPTIPLKDNGAGGKVSDWAFATFSDPMTVKNNTFFY